MKSRAIACDALIALAILWAAAELFWRAMV